MNKDETGAVSTANALKMAIGIAEKAIKHWKNNIDDLDAKQWEKIDKYEDKLYDLKEALDTKQVCENAAPAQEPVGYWYIMPNGNVYQAKVGEEVPSDYIKIREPNPAQPLSDDEINKLLSKFVECLGTSHGIQENGIPEDNAVKFIRAIEQAHGIV